MAERGYAYNGKIWRPQPTVSDHNSFFHAAFGEGEPRLDKDANFRRKSSINFLNYFEKTTKPDGLKKCLEVALETNESHDCHSTRYKALIDNLSSKQTICTREIPLLASLEGAVVVLFVDNNEVPEIFYPIDNFLGNYPRKIKTATKEAVVCLRDRSYVGLRFDRFAAPPVALPGEPGEETEEEIAVERAPSVRKPYPKLQGCAGIKGSLYQINLLSIFLLKGSKQFKTFWMSTENMTAGKFDDAVFEVSPSKTFLLQAKHKLNKRITYDDLYQTNSDKDDFSLPMYYLSYQKVKRLFNVHRMTLCTNTDLIIPKDKTMEFDRGSLDETDILFFDTMKHQCYTFNDSVILPLIEKAKEYKKRNLKDQTFDDQVFDHGEVKQFLSKFRLVTGYASKGDFNDVIEGLLREEQHCTQYQTRDCFKFINNKILEWFDYEKGIYLTQDSLKTFLCEFQSSKFCEKLQNFHVHVEGSHIDYDTPKRLLRIESRRRYVLNMIHAGCVLYPTKRKCLFLNAKEDFDAQLEMVDTFERTGYDTLVACFKAPDSASIQAICDRVTDVLQRKTWKKLILFTNGNCQLARLLKEKNLEEYEEVYESITLNDLSLETKEKILQIMMMSTM